MTAATVTRYIETADPTTEVVVLTVSNDEEFTSRKFTQIQAALISPNQRITSVLTAVPSVEFNPTTAVVTVNWQGITDNLATLQLWGN